MSQKRVVIVEDELWLAEQYMRLLGKADFAVHHAPHAISAIDVIDDVRPDAIVVDMLLSGSTALVLLHELKSHTDLASIPIVVASSIADQIQPEDLKHYGVRRILDKTTMHPEDIVHAVRAVL